MSKPARHNFFGGLIALQGGEWIDPATLPKRCCICGEGAEESRAADMQPLCPNCCAKGIGRTASRARITRGITHRFSGLRDRRTDPGTIFTLRCIYCGLRKPEEDNG